jgi:hypothetical protein
VSVKGYPSFTLLLGKPMCLMSIVSSISWRKSRVSWLEGIGLNHG